MCKLFEPSRLVLTLAALALAQTLANGVQVLQSISAGPRTWSERVEMMSASLAIPARDSSPLDSLRDSPRLDSLRDAASLGDAAAESRLVRQLLDSYERSRDSEELLEAVQWMDRSWEWGEHQQSGMATRVFERYCDHRVLKWHWLCNPGE